MINDAQNTMMTGAPKEKAQTLFHFSGDGIYYAKAILAATIEEAEKIWHETKVLISQSTSAPAEIPTEQKVEDKSTETTQ